MYKYIVCIYTPPLKFIESLIEPITQVPPLALIVDHRLRPESSVEAAEAAQHAQDIGLRSKVLSVDWGTQFPKRHHKMRAAREARYDLLFTACRENGCKHLFTAHHADDQAETFLLRLIHASGLDGLAAMSSVNRSFIESHGVRLVRPLLGVYKSELISLCDGAGLWYAKDPSNEDPTFQRNRLRLLLQETAIAERAAALDALSTGDDSVLDEMMNDRPPFIVQDILTLQSLCARVSRGQTALAESLLKETVMWACQINRYQLHRVLERRQNALLKEKVVHLVSTHGELCLPRRRIHWPTQLAAYSYKLQEMPHIIIDLQPWASASTVIRQVAISMVLQTISDSAYPPSLSDTSKLAERVCSGRLIGGFTGGGCAVAPIVHSKGRYILVVPQKMQSRVRELLSFLHPAQPRSMHERPIEAIGRAVGV